MMDHQKDRLLPECQCPANCGGRPEASRRMTPAYPIVRPGDARPPPSRTSPAVSVSWSSTRSTIDTVS